MTAITDGQVELRAGDPDALVIGAGTDFRFDQDFVQWWHAPELVTGDTKYSTVDGYLGGLDLLGKHTTTLVVQILADTESQLGDNIDLWKAACAETLEGRLAIRGNLLGRTRQRFGRFRIPGDVTVDTWSLVAGGPAPAGGQCSDRLRAIGSTQFEALDPRTYGDVARFDSTGRSVVGAGFTPPFTPPFTPGAGSSGILTIVNLGNRPGTWTGQIVGPLAGITITHLETGRRLALTANGGVDIEAGATLDFDSLMGTIRYNGLADRDDRLTIDSQWAQIARGSNSFQLDADSGSGILTVTSYDAWRS